MKSTSLQSVVAILLITLLPALLPAQSPDRTQLIGSVEDPNGESIPGASVVLYQPDGESMVTGTSSDHSGSFSLSAEPGEYLLQITYVSYAPYRSDIQLQADEPLELSIIVLEPDQTELEEIVIEEERSTMTMNFDSRVFNVGSDVTSMGGTALDVLDNVPSLSTDIEGNVSLRGSEGVQVLINGRPSSLVRDGTDALASIPAEVIQEVEIITNPSARYSAQGSGGIINIVLKEGVQLGLNGSMALSSGYPYNHEGTIRLNYHVNNINWFFSANTQYQDRPGGGDIFQRFSSPDTSYVYDQGRDTRRTELDGRFRFGSEIYLPADQILTATTYIRLEDGDSRADVVYRDYTPGMELLQRSTREDVEDAGESDYDFRLEYENVFGTDHRLTADANFEFGIENESSNLLQIIETGEGSPLNQRTANRELYNDFRLQADYERPVGDNGRFETGFRSTIDWQKNDYSVEELQGNIWEELPSYNDNFEYTERVHSLYAVYSGEVASSFGYQLGLRAEQSSIETQLTRQSDLQSDQSYLNLFPSLFLTYSFDEANSVQVSYSRRYRRPRYRMLLPFSGFTDSRNISRGNPSLEPEFANSFEAGFLRHWETGSVLTSIYYRHRTGVIERITSQELNPRGDLVTVRYPINLATENAWGIEWSGDQDLLENLQLAGSANLYQSHREGSYEGNLLESQSTSFQSRLRLRWRFLNNWTLQSSFFYNAPRTTTQGRRPALTFVNAGLSRQLLDGKAVLSLSVRDVFNSRQYLMIIEEEDFYSERSNRWSTRSARLFFRYRF